MLRQAAYILVTRCSPLSCVIPFAWVLLTSVDANAGLYLQLPTLTLDNFVEFFTEEGTPRLLANSIWIATASTALTLAFGIFGAYALSRYRFFARRTLMFGILLIRVVPPTATIVPLYMIMINLGLNDTYTGLILVEAAYQLPLALWLLKGFIDSIPMELEEAAWIDGCSRLKGAWRVVFPLARPGIGACAPLSFINVWGTSSPRSCYSSRRKSTHLHRYVPRVLRPESGGLGPAHRDSRPLHGADGAPLPLCTALPVAGHRVRSAEGLEPALSRNAATIRRVRRHDHGR